MRPRRHGCWPTGSIFAVAQGECLLLRGPNGAGKISLLLTLAGIVRADGGQRSRSRAAMPRLPQLHYCGHRNAIKPRLSVLRKPALSGPSVNGADAASVPRRRWTTVGLGGLGGARCRLSLGRADRGGWRWRGCWSATAPLWLLDEPTAALDAEARRWWRG